MNSGSRGGSSRGSCNRCYRQFLPTCSLSLTEDDVNVYTLNVGNEDFERAQKDLNFAQSLLFHAKCTEKPKPYNPVCEEQISEDEINPIDHNEDAGELSVASNSNKNCSNDESHHKGSWSYDETLCLINSMETHMENLYHPKKKKTVFEDVANDLGSHGFAVTGHQCNLKWKSLVRSYKICKDNKLKTGKGPSRFNFFTEIDNLLGDKPSNNCIHAVESSEVGQIDVVQIEENNNNENELTEEGEIVIKDTGPEETQTTSRKRKNKEVDQCNLSSLIKVKKDEYLKREERHQEKVAIEREKIALLRTLIEKLN